MADEHRPSTPTDGVFQDVHILLQAVDEPLETSESLPLPKERHGQRHIRCRPNFFGTAKHLMAVRLQTDDDEPSVASDTATAVGDREVKPLMHQYRGEVQRLTAYRQRMDMTTNWAVSMTGVLVAFSLGSKDTPHFFFAFVLMLQLFFCFVEARRHAYYVLVRRRCRQLERGMYAHILAPDLPAMNCRRALRDSYMPDMNLLPFRKSFTQRLKRIYAFLAVATYLGWTFKLMTLLDIEGFPWTVFGPVTAVMLIFVAWIYFLVHDNSVDV